MIRVTGALQSLVDLTLDNSLSGLIKLIPESSDFQALITNSSDFGGGCLFSIITY